MWSTTDQFAMPYFAGVKRALAALGILQSLSFVTPAVAVPPTAGPDTATETVVPAAHVQLGPVFQLADQEVDDTRLAVTADMHAHVLLHGRKGGFTYVLVDSAAARAAEPIGPSVARRNNFAAALTRDGTLHVVIDEQHYTRTAERWSQPVAGPPCIALSVAANRLVCAMVVSGSDVHAPRRWTWTLVGGYGGAIIFPWHQQTQKLVLVRSTETGWSSMTAVDTGTKYDVDLADRMAHVSIAGDDVGSVLVAYVPYTNGPRRPRYARISLTTQNAQPPLEPANPTADSVRQVDSVDSNELPLIPGTKACVSVAVDPSTGDGLIVAQGMTRNGGGLLARVREPNHAFTVHDSTVSAPFSVAGDRFKLANPKAVMSGKTDPRVYLAPAGRGRYHGVVAWGDRHRRLILYYVTYDSGVWSVPVLLGSSSTAFSNPIQIGSAASGPLFVSWTDDENKPVGRWITLGE